MTGDECCQGAARDWRFVGFGLLLCVVPALGCAGPPGPSAPVAVDWRAVAPEWSVQLVTADKDGAERVSRMRIAVVDGSGAVRTGASRWRRNLEREPTCALRRGGTQHAVVAERVTRAAELERIQAAFAEKYGWQERVFLALWLGEMAVFRLAPAPAGGGNGGHEASSLP